MADAPGKPQPQKIGKYEVMAQLGKGAMGVVYRARDPFIGREVALKTMLKELVEGEEEQQRFFREAQAAGNLKHPHIVTIYELGMDVDTAFIAMELLEGSDLKKLMREKPDTPLEITADVLEGLDYAHKRGIVHRDIKPANIHIGDDGIVIRRFQDCGFYEYGYVRRGSSARPAAGSSSSQGETALAVMRRQALSVLPPPTLGEGNAPSFADGSRRYQEDSRELVGDAVATSELFSSPWVSAGMGNS